MSKQEKINYLQYPEGSIFSKGYGTIAKIPMQDRDLTIEAKAIYSYLCSYMGIGDSAFPSVSKILHDLNISENRFYKHMEILKNSGYVKVYNCTRNDGTYVNNVYEIVMTFDKC